MQKKDIDLTTGILWKQILIFSLPLVLSNLLQVVFNLADIAVVGQFAGTLALGAVGSTTLLVALFTSVLIGMSGAVNVLVALAIGAGQNKKLEETVHTAGIISAAIGIILMAAGLVFSENILILLHTKEELLPGAVSYLHIYFLGLPALAIYNFGNAVFSAAGDTKKPLIFLSIAGAVNITLNLIFVIVFKMGVKGVATASAVSQYISALLILISLFKSNAAYRLSWSAMHITHYRMIRILQLGLPAALQGSIFCIANLFVQMGVNSFNATVVAGNSAAGNADNLIYDIMAAFYTACASFIGQNLGAGNKKRILKSYQLCLIYSFGIAFILGILLRVFGHSFLSVFSHDEEVIKAGIERIGIMALSYCVSAFMDCTIAASRAFGKVVVPTIVVILGSCVFRVAWIYTVFAMYKTTTSLYLLYVFSWTITGMAEIIYFVPVYRKRTKNM